MLQLSGYIMIKYAVTFVATSETHTWLQRSSHKQKVKETVFNYYVQWSCADNQKIGFPL